MELSVIKQTNFNQSLPDFREAFFLIIMKKKRIALLGEEGSFHHLVAKELFTGQEMIHCEKFEELTVLVEQNKADFAVMAIENSTAGSILPNYELIRKSSLLITQEYYRKIALSLLGKQGRQLSEIRKVASHPMALLQCKSFLDSLPELELIESKNTAEGAHLVAKNIQHDLAAIADAALAEGLGLQILQKDVQSFKDNYTRFFILQRPKRTLADPDKSTVCFTLPHQAGSLADVLMNLKLNNYNLSKIQSLPVQGAPGRYFFYLDIEYPCGGKEKELKKLMQLFAHDLKIMGSYKKQDLF